MSTEYLVVKFVHILVAILALGTSAGLGIVLELYGDHRTQGAFVLRVIERMVGFFVLPGYALMLATGVWMVHLGWPSTTKWIQAPLVLWGIGAVILGMFLAVLHRQTGLFDAEGPASASYRRVSLFGRALGAGVGLVVVFILYLMVFKPGA
jgi:uncharacterized membrane protein